MILVVFEAISETCTDRGYVALKSFALEKLPSRGDVKWVGHGIELTVRNVIPVGINDNTVPVVTAYVPWRIYARLVFSHGWYAVLFESALSDEPLWPRS